MGVKLGRSDTDGDERPVDGGGAHPPESMGETRETAGYVKHKKFNERVCERSCKLEGDEVRDALDRSAANTAAPSIFALTAKIFADTCLKK